MNLPREIVLVLEASISSSTLAHYESVFKRWNSFCVEKGYSLWCPVPSNLMEFLHKMYKQGQSYSSINCAKSALSSILSLKNNEKIGEIEIMKRFMKGIFRLRPPTAKYCTTWDADKLLKLLIDWPDNEMLDAKCLTLKTVALLALTSGQRAQTLANVMISNMKWGNELQIIFTAVLKTTKPNNPNPIVTLPKNDNKKICVYEALRAYVNRTSVLRGSHDNLFLGITKPHKPVTSQTIGKWLISVLNLAGIDTSNYQGHSFRHASSSKVASRGVSVDNILKHVGWSESSSVFGRFYNRPIEQNEFVKNVLSVD